MAAPVGGVLHAPRVDLLERVAVHLPAGGAVRDGRRAEDLDETRVARCICATVQSRGRLRTLSCQYT
jgi:hypothetical protein